jgi:hypothetical protein
LNLSFAGRVALSASIWRGVISGLKEIDAEAGVGVLGYSGGILSLPLEPYRPSQRNRVSPPSPPLILPSSDLVYIMLDPDDPLLLKILHECPRAASSFFAFEPHHSSSSFVEAARTNLAGCKVAVFFPAEDTDRLGLCFEGSFDLSGLREFLNSVPGWELQPQAVASTSVNYVDISSWGIEPNSQVTAIVEERASSSSSSSLGTAKEVHYLKATVQNLAKWLPVALGGSDLYAAYYFKNLPDTVLAQFCGSPPLLFRTISTSEALPLIKMTPMPPLTLTHQMLVSVRNVSVVSQNFRFNVPDVIPYFSICKPGALLYIQLRTTSGCFFVITPESFLSSMGSLGQPPRPPVVLSLSLPYLLLTKGLKSGRISLGTSTATSCMEAISSAGNSGPFTCTVRDRSSN